MRWTADEDNKTVSNDCWFVETSVRVSLVRVTNVKWPGEEARMRSDTRFLVDLIT